MVRRGGRRILFNKKKKKNAKLTLKNVNVYGLFSSHNIQYVHTRYCILYEKWMTHLLNKFFLNKKNVIMLIERAARKIYSYTLTNVLKSMILIGRFNIQFHIENCSEILISLEWGKRTELNYLRFVHFAMRICSTQNLWHIHLIFTNIKLLRRSNENRWKRKKN